MRTVLRGSTRSIVDYAAGTDARETVVDSVTGAEIRINLDDEALFYIEYGGNLYDAYDRREAAKMLANIRKGKKYPDMNPRAPYAPWHAYSSRRPRKWAGYAKEIRGSGGQKYAYYGLDGKLHGTYSTTGTKEQLKKAVRAYGYMIRSGLVEDPYANPSASPDCYDRCSNNPVYGYVGFYKNKRFEVYASSTLEARDKIAREQKIKKPWEIAVVLAEKDGKPVTHMPLFNPKGKRTKFIDQYMNEVYMYGGIPMRRADIIRDLQAITGDQRLIDRYQQAMDRKRPLVGVEPVSYAEFKKAVRSNPARGKTKGNRRNPAPQVAPVSSEFVGHWIKPDDWPWGSVLTPGLSGFCEYFLPVTSKGPVREVAVNVRVTGRTNVIRSGLVVRRVLITFVGDYEPSVTAGGWMEVYPAWSPKKNPSVGNPLPLAGLGSYIVAGLGFGIGGTVAHDAIRHVKKSLKKNPEIATATRQGRKKGTRITRLASIPGFDDLSSEDRQETFKRKGIII